MHRDDPQLLRIRFVRGLLLATSGEYPAARSELEEVAKFHREADTADARFDLQVAGALSRLYVDIGDLALAESTLREAVQRAARFMDPGSAALLSQRARLTRILTDRAKYTEAGREVDGALEIARKTRGAGNTLVIELELARGLLLAEQERFEEARSIMQPAVDLFAQGTPPEDGVLLSFQSALARVDQWGGDLDTAESRLRHIIEMERSHASKDSVRVANSEIALADVLREAGRTAEARALIQNLSPKALERVRANGPTHAELLRIEGLIAVAEGQSAAGAAAVEDALRDETRYFGENHFWIRKARSELARELDES